MKSSAHSRHTLVCSKSEPGPTVGQGPRLHFDPTEHRPAPKGHWQGDHINEEEEEEEASPNKGRGNQVSPGKE